MSAGFPVLAVEGLDPQIQALGRVETARVDAPAIRVRARAVEALHPAFRAEQVLRHPGVEAVFAQAFRALGDAEPALRHDHVDEAGLAAHGAIAALRLDRLAERHLEAHAAALAAAGPPGEGVLAHL